MKKMTQEKTEPLYVIFEQHLYHFHDAEMDRQSFVDRVVHEYLKFLRQKQITVPTQLLPQIVEELGSQVKTMLLKKIYGCYSIEEYQKKAKRSSKKKARARYQAIQKISG